jgi:hypothetical protein
MRLTRALLQHCKAYAVSRMFIWYTWCESAQVYRACNLHLTLLDKPTSNHHSSSSALPYVIQVVHILYVGFPWKNTLFFIQDTWNPRRLHSDEVCLTNWEKPCQVFSLRHRSTLVYVYWMKYLVFEAQIAGVKTHCNSLKEWLVIVNSYDCCALC